MTLIEQRVLEAIDLDGLISLLCDLVAVKSVCGDEVVAQEHVAAQMQRMGLEVDLWEIDLAELSQHPAFGMEVERPRAGAGAGHR